MRNVPLFCVCLAMIMLSLPAFGRSFRTRQVPHGETLSCQTCHFSGNGGAVNAFGYDVSLTLNNGDAQWSAVCMLDSDADGYTNGVELGDPDCLWSIGNATPVEPPTFPGDPTSNPAPPSLDMDIDMEIADAEVIIDMEIVDLGPDLDPWDQLITDWRPADAFETTSEGTDQGVPQATGGLEAGAETGGASSGGDAPEVGGTGTQMGGEPDGPEEGGSMMGAGDADPDSPTSAGETITFDPDAPEPDGSGSPKAQIKGCAQSYTTLRSTSDLTPAPLSALFWLTLALGIIRRCRASSAHAVDR